MLLTNNKVADDGTSAQPLQEGQAMVDSLTKHVKCREDCQELYIGETKQPLAKRMAQHRTATSSGQDSVVYTHLQASGHSFKDEDVKILDREERWFQRGVKEAIFVKRERPSLNRGGGLRVHLSPSYNAAITAIPQSCVVACYRHLVSCVGGCTDSSSLRHELKQTRERAQALALSCRNHLTAKLRDKTLPEEERKATELQWVTFSSCLELFHADMCKVYHMGKCFSVANNSAMVQTGMQGGSTEVAARALSMPDLQQKHDVQTASMEGLEQSQLEQEMLQVDQTLEDMEMKVNVLRWTVEAQGPQYGEPLSTDSASLAMLCGDEEVADQRFCDRSQMFVVMLLCGVAAVAVVLSVCVVFLA